MAVLIAQVIPTSSEERNREIVALNAEIAGLQSLGTPGSPVVVVDQFSGYDGARDNQDGGVHPIESGEQKMAARWMAALLPLLSGRVTPTVVPTAAPAVAPTSVERSRTRSRTIASGSLSPIHAFGTATVTPSPPEDPSSGIAVPVIRPFGRYAAGSRWTATW